jgi:pimeloyl-ACP methyl ester carboxylesterase
MHTIEHGMFVRTVGDGAAGGTLLFVHGLGESGLCFEALLPRPELSPYRLLVPDLPGYGRSAWPDGAPLSLVGLADHLADWLGHRGERPVTVVGHSMGGVVAQMLAERHPATVAAVVDVDGNKSEGDCVFSSRAAAYDRAAFLDRGFDVLRETVYRRGKSDQAQRGYYVSLRLADPRSYHQHSLELLTLSRGEELAPRLAALPQPKHYIAAVPDGATERSRTLLSAAGVPWSAIAPSGHWPFIDQPDAFVALLARLVAGD